VLGTFTFSRLSNYTSVGCLSKLLYPSQLMSTWLWHLLA